MVTISIIREFRRDERRTPLSPNHIKILKEHYPDPTDKTGRFVVVDVKTKYKFKNPVNLEQIKNNPKLSDIPLIKQSRLSVMPIRISEWNAIIKISEKQR